MNKGGRPVNKRPEQLIHVAQENDRLRRLNGWELKRLLHLYYDGSLAEWDNSDTLPTGMSPQLRQFFAKTTGKTLLQRASHTLMDEIVNDIRNTPGMGFEHGWWIYCLRVWADLENQYSPDNDDLPIPNGGHLREAFLMYARLVHDRILNSK